jgi:hypothetical protein
MTLGDIKSKTKAGTGMDRFFYIRNLELNAMTGCGGCMPLVTNIFKSEMKRAVSAVCPFQVALRIYLTKNI